MLDSCEWNGSGSSPFRPGESTPIPFARNYSSEYRFNNSGNEELYMFVGASATPSPIVSFSNAFGVAYTSTAVVSTTYNEGSYGQFQIQDSSGHCLTYTSTGLMTRVCSQTTDQIWTRSGLGIINLLSREEFSFISAINTTSKIKYQLMGTTGSCVTASSVSSYNLETCLGESSNNSTYQHFTIVDGGWSFYPGSKWIAIRKYAENPPVVSPVSTPGSNWLFQVTSDASSIPGAVVGGTRSIHISLDPLASSSSYTSALSSQTEFDAKVTNLSSPLGSFDGYKATLVSRTGWTGLGVGSNEILVTGSGFLNTTQSHLLVPFTNYRLFPRCRYINSSVLSCTTLPAPFLGSSVLSAGMGSRSLSLSLNGKDYITDQIWTYFAVTFVTYPQSAPLDGGTNVTIIATLYGLSFAMAELITSKETSYLWFGSQMTTTTGPLIYTSIASETTQVAITFIAPPSPTGISTTVDLKLALVGDQTLDSNGYTSFETQNLATNSALKPIYDATTAAVKFFYYSDSDWTHSPNGGLQQGSSFPGTTVRFRGSNMSTLMTPTFNFTNSVSGSTCNEIEVSGSASKISFSPGITQGNFSGQVFILDDTISYLEYQSWYSRSNFDYDSYNPTTNTAITYFTALYLKVPVSATFGVYDFEVAYALVFSDLLKNGFSTALNDTAFTTVYGPAIISQGDLSGILKLQLHTELVYQPSYDIVLRIRRRMRPLLSPLFVSAAASGARFAHRLNVLPTSLVAAAQQEVSGVLTSQTSLISTHNTYTFLEVQFETDDVEMSAYVLDSTCGVGLDT
eukprot:22379-Amorphochlora_amoeboformis.AAC.1